MEQLITLCISNCLFIILLTSPWTEAKPTTTTTTSNGAGGINISTIASIRLTAISSELSDLQHLNKTCLSRDCDEHVNLKQLQNIASQMNRSIDPCDNFHEYACSQWQQQHGKEHTMMAVGEQMLTQKYQHIFSAHIERRSGGELRADIVYRKLYNYYETCVESERNEKASWRAYIATLREMGVLHLNNQTYWLETLKELNLYSNSDFFISLQMHRFNASLFMLNIDPHNVMKRARVTPEIYDILKYYQYTNDSLEEVQKKFQNLEIDLENILNSSCVNKVQDENDECDLNEWLKFEELAKHNASSFDWRDLLNFFSLRPNDLISVTDIGGLEKIKIYLDLAEPQTLLMYAISRFINHLQSHTHNIVSKGSSASSCLRHMRKIFPLTMNYVFEKVFYNPELRSQSDAVIETVFHQLKQQFSLRLDNNHMELSADSIQYLKKKLFALQLNIGNLPKNVSPEFYHEFVMDLNVTDNFYLNHLNALKHFFRRQRVLASAEKFSPMWYTFNLHLPDFLDALDSTAYYFCNANMIVLPFAYLQLPFYDHRFWPSLLFGDLANTLGHELIHAFDTTFLAYDYGGNFNNIESQKILTNSQFIANLACLNQNPTEFLTERIADISGTRLALRTFAKDPIFLQQNGKLFFMQFAQFFCGSASEEEFAAQDDTHDMDSKRLHYTLAHLTEFAEVFACPVGSAMNPSEKCRLW